MKSIVFVNAVKAKHKMYSQWKKSITTNNKLGDHELLLRFKNYRKTLKHVIKKAKKSFYADKFKNSKGDLKKTWKLINDLRGKRRIAYLLPS